MTIINLQGINITPPYLQHNREPLSTFDPRPNVVPGMYIVPYAMTSLTINARNDTP